MKGPESEQVAEVVLDDEQREYQRRRSSRLELRCALEASCLPYLAICVTVTHMTSLCDM